MPDLQELTDPPSGFSADTLLRPLVTNVVVSLTKMTCMPEGFLYGRHGYDIQEDSGQALMVNDFCGAASNILAFEHDVHMKFQDKNCHLYTLKYAEASGDYSAAYRACALMRDFWATKCPPDMQEACKKRLDMVTRTNGVKYTGSNLAQHH